MYGQHTATATGLTGLAYTGMQVGWMFAVGLMLIWAGWTVRRIVKRKRRQG